MNLLLKSMLQASLKDLPSFLQCSSAQLHSAERLLVPTSNITPGKNKSGLNYVGWGIESSKGIDSEHVTMTSDAFITCLKTQGFNRMMSEFLALTSAKSA